MERIQVRGALGRVISIVSILGLAGALAACAPTPMSSTSSEELDAEVMEFVWSSDSDCTTCHNESESFEDSETIASLHSQLQTSCVQCHKDADALGAVHEKATPGEPAKVKRLKKTSVESDNCAACHDADALPEKTVVDNNGLAVNVHVLPEVADHEAIQCADCHKVHGPSDTAAEAQKFCKSCHHENVYECHTCHN